MNLIIKGISLLITILVYLQISFLNLNLGTVYYVLLIIPFLYLLLISKRFKFNFLMVWFSLSCLISILLNDIPDLFQPYQRFGIFIIIVGLIGPLINNSLFFRLRILIGNMLNNAILSLVIFSFIGISLGLPFMLGRGGFTGFFNHSMMLGPMSSLAILISLHKAQISENRKIYWFFLGLASLAFITCVAAGSRSALLAGLLGSSFFFYKLNQDKLTRFVRIIVGLIAFGVFSFPIWEPFTERLMEKIVYSEDQGDALVTRSFLWDMRISEFKSSPVIGVGFASVDPKISIKFNEEDGKVEPGSSWLAILSMTGLLGFIPILILLVKYLIFLLNDRIFPVRSAFLGGMMLLFVVHMMAEGYVLSAGSGLFFYFWLTLGVIDGIQTDVKLSHL